MSWYPALTHPALDRLRDVLSVSDRTAASAPNGRTTHSSLHDRFLVDWTAVIPDLDASAGVIGRRTHGRPLQVRTMMLGHCRHVIGRILESGLRQTGLGRLKPNIPATRELHYAGNVARRLRRVVRKGPAGEALATLRRALKDIDERRRKTPKPASARRT